MRTYIATKSQSILGTSTVDVSEGESTLRELINVITGNPLASRILTYAIIGTFLMFVFAVGKGLANGGLAGVRGAFGKLLLPFAIVLAPILIVLGWGLFVAITTSAAGQLGGV